MENTQTASLISIFSALQDPRIDRTKRHKLTDIITIAICAVVCGADSWVDVELFGKSREEWLRGFLELSGGIPSHDTFGRVFSMLDAERFQSCFVEWVSLVSEITEGQIVAIDGKTVRRSHDSGTGKSAIHLVNAWASANRVVLGQVKVEDKSNEITAIPKLLQMLELSGCIVTIDAMGCQKEIARTITERGADYVLALKLNQGQLHDDVVEMFEYGRQTDFADMDSDWFETVEKGHGRVETRRCATIFSPEFISYLNEGERWSNLKSVAMVESERSVGGNVSSQTRYYISSLGGDAKRLLESVRGHWEVENSVHWVLDVSFGEDASRVRKGNGAEIFAVLRRMALNMLRREDSLKVGIAAKRKKAGWDHEYLLKVLAQ